MRVCIYVGRHQQLHNQDRKAEQHRRFTAVNRRYRVKQLLKPTVALEFKKINTKKTELNSNQCISIHACLHVLLNIGRAGHALNRNTLLAIELQIHIGFSNCLTLYIRFLSLDRQMTDHKNDRQMDKINCSILLHACVCIVTTQRETGST